MKKTIHLTPTTPVIEPGDEVEIVTEDRGTVACTGAQLLVVKILLGALPDKVTAVKHVKALGLCSWEVAGTMVDAAALIR